MFPVQFGQRLKHLGGIVATHALEELPGLFRGSARGARVGLDQILLGFLFQGTALGLVDLACLAKLDHVDEDSERGLEIAEVDLRPTLLVHRESVD